MALTNDDRNYFTLHDEASSVRMNEVASPKECVLVMQELDRITYLIKFGCLAKKSINEQTKFRLLRDEV